MKKAYHQPAETVKSGDSGFTVTNIGFLR